MNQKNPLALSSLSPSPYPLRSAEAGFIFETDFGITYEIRFTDDSGYVPESSFFDAIFSISVTLIAGQITQKDPRVEQTIVQAILLTFDASPNTVLNYVCGLDNDQEVARNRLFQHWYRKIGIDHFIKIDRTDFENRIYTSVIFRRDHPAEREIRSRLTDVFDK